MASGTPGRASMEETGRPGPAGAPAACGVRFAEDGWARACREAPACWAADGADPVAASGPAASGPPASGAGPSGVAAAPPAAAAGVPAAALVPAPEPVPASEAPEAGGTAAGTDEGAAPGPDAVPSPEAVAGAEAVVGAGRADDDDGDDDGAGPVGVGVRVAGAKGVPEVAGSGRWGSNADTEAPAVMDADAVPALRDVCAAGSWGGAASSAKDAWTPVERTSIAPTAAAAVPRRSPPWIPVRDIESSDLC
jgi:hypothetical protein